jgi:aryl-alcohol dehydrogenase-like predicted oxidoreductase
VSYNLLNPSAGKKLPENYPAQDYGCLLARADTAGVGVIGIRALAGGALSGTEARHPLGSPPPEPIGSGASYAADVRRAALLLPLVEEGFAENLPEAALRFVMSHPGIATTLVGLSSLEHLEAALGAADRGPLPAAGLARAAVLQENFTGEAR